jgi:hypothetical protein
MRVENHLSYAAFQYLNGAAETSNGLTLGDIVIKGNEIGVIIQIHDKDEFRVDQWGNTCVDECRLATADEIWQFRPGVFNDGKFVFTYHRKPTAGEIKFGHGATHYRDFHITECRDPKTGDPKKRLKADDGLIYTR